MRNKKKKGGGVNSHLTGVSGKTSVALDNKKFTQIDCKFVKRSCEGEILELGLVKC